MPHECEYLLSNNNSVLLRVYKVYTHHTEAHTIYIILYIYIYICTAVNHFIPIHNYIQLFLITLNVSVVVAFYYIIIVLIIKLLRFYFRNACIVRVNFYLQSSTVSNVL